MDLRSGNSFWLLKNGLLATYPALATDERCEVAVIGGGITGALLAFYLTEAGVDVIVLDKRDIGSGSTAASTGLLMYEVDTELIDLIDVVGEEYAVRAYRAGLDAVQELGHLVRNTGDDCGYRPQETLYFASKKGDLEKLRREYDCRQQYGFAVQFLETEEIQERFHVAAPGAILAQGNARIDPYRLTHRLMATAAQNGARIYDRTTVTKLRRQGRGFVLQTDRRSRVTAQRIAFATGYESQIYLRQRVERLHSTFVIISEPLVEPSAVVQNTLMWETARPYFYLRGTDDGRLILGGQDTPYGTDHARDRLIRSKSRALERRFGRLFPTMNWETAYAWAGTFGESKDGLAYIGETPEYPRAYFALAYGGNGITFGVIAAGIIRDLYLGRPHPDASVFRFNR